MDLFDIDNLTKNIFEVGTLNQEVIDLLNLNLSEKKIMFSDDKIKYAKKHSHKFKSYEEYKKSIESTPYIILNPDYVALHPNGQSIEYIKQLDELVLVAVRVKSHGNLWIKSFYPITKAKLNLYIKSGTAKKFQKGIDKNK